MNITSLKNLPFLNIQYWRNFNPYYLARSAIFLIDPEKAHSLTIKFLQQRLLPKLKNDTEKSLSTTLCGLTFPNPIGLAAGFDKNAEVISEVLNLGFGYTEVGSITPRPQPGNPTPRLFRIPSSLAVINRFGFNSEGMDIVRRRLIAWYDNHTKLGRGIVGINLGKNKDSLDAAADYVAGFKTFSPFASYIAINISSPNTSGLRDLQSRAPLTDLLQQLMAVHAASNVKPPIFVKIAPDQTEQDLEDIVEVIMQSGVHGIIVSNTTITRPDSLPPQVAKEAGGLSGEPLRELSTEVLRRVYKLTQGKIPLIGCGGVSTAEDAYEKILAGASLVQLYTGMVYEGPFIARRINRKLSQLLKHDGFKSLRDAVGAGNR